MKGSYLDSTQQQLKQFWQDMLLGKENGLYQLFQVVYDQFYRFGMLAVPDSQLVKSSISSVFLALWTKRDSLPEVDNVQGYLFICFKRELFRSIQKENSKNPTVGELSPGLLTESSYEDALIGHELDNLRKTRIKVALNTLSARQRQFIQQRFFEELSYEEIAEQSNTTVRTVYNTIHSAIARLRTELSDWELFLLFLIVVEKF